MVERIISKIYEVMTDGWTYYFLVMLVVVWIVYLFGGKGQE